MSEPILSSLPLWILLLPLIGFFVNGVAYPLAAKGLRHTHAGVAGGFAVAMMLASFVLSCIAFVQLAGSAAPLLQPVLQWIDLPDLSLALNLRIDRLSSLMTLIITGVGTLIHIYSIGYMSHEEGAARFFAYLNLFCFAMLLLVLSDNLLFVFFGWEGVGLCSYLLISYWYKETANADAARKAFLVNRVGDLGFVLAMCILLANLGTLSFVELAKNMAPEALGMIGVAAFLLFFAATGKSAQIPLYVWLPDAMAGPTPVSALIHAATMVTAGVYLFARMNFMFELFPDLMQLVAWIGALTALLGGTIALAQNDIKRVLAYSTVSQLGFMFLAVGVGAYQAAVFHLMTHAFFKALLFLGAGSVIHGCEGEQDMRKMGGLAKSLPHTYWTMLIGSGAIMGLPLLSGFFSKDEILYHALVLPRGGWLLFAVGAAAAFLTAVYILRMLQMTFWGDARSQIHAHESPAVMTMPLMVLAALAAISGFLGIPHEWGHALGVEHALSQWLAPAVPLAAIDHSSAPSETLISAIAVALSIVGIVLGFKLFKKRFDIQPQGIGKFLEAKYYIDEVYTALLVKPLYRIGDWFSRALEGRLFGNVGTWMGTGSLWSGDRLKAIQNGDIQVFTLAITAGLVTIVCILLFWTHA